MDVLCLHQVLLNLFNKSNTCGFWQQWRHPIVQAKAAALVLQELMSPRSRKMQWETEDDAITDAVGFRHNHPSIDCKTMFTGWDLQRKHSASSPQ